MRKFLRRLTMLAKYLLGNGTENIVCNNCNGYMKHSLQNYLGTYSKEIEKPIVIGVYTLYFNHIPDKGGFIRYQIEKNG